MSSLPPIPSKLEGTIFTEIAPQLIPEIDMGNLVKLGAIVNIKNRIENYEPLTDSLRKIQWVKLNGLRAIAIEQEIAAQGEPNTVVIAPIHQIEHALSITDCIIHTKSALDSMAIFLTDLLKLPVTGGERDLKIQKFRDSIGQNDPGLGQLVKSLELWFNELQGVRDEWIHRSSIRSIMIIGQSDVGLLPIPKDVTLGIKASRLNVNKHNFWSTKEFVNRNYLNLVQLFIGIIERCIDIEKRNLPKLPPIPSDAEKMLMLFPFLAIEPMTITKMKLYLGPSNN